jgi:hypothetical protein
MSFQLHVAVPLLRACLTWADSLCIEDGAL